MTATDPYQVLGIEQTASDEEIRAAYLRMIQEHPPDRDPVMFERVRDAYAELRDPRETTRRRLFGGPAVLPLKQLLDGHAPERRFTGPKAWLAVLNEK
ncbi:J domain-containing protein [uncultured Paludibaculum sp.]|uniref:J domain-containing protein n=1 Tax=uncultured Paludibaculum sp. TaxID=1765020 RepID=UPI002AAC4C43|nr:J domain-containing protein [uncultured Paludibaculum sp.]